LLSAVTCLKEVDKRNERLRTWFLVQNFGSYVSEPETKADFSSKSKSFKFYFVACFGSRRDAVVAFVAVIVFVALLFLLLSLIHVNPLNAELNPICYLLALLGAHHFLHISRIRVKSLTLRLLMSYIYGAPILDVSRSHTTTHHSR